MCFKTDCPFSLRWLIIKSTARSPLDFSYLSWFTASSGVTVTASSSHLMREVLTVWSFLFIISVDSILKAMPVICFFMLLFPSKNKILFLSSWSRQISHTCLAVVPHADEPEISSIAEPAEAESFFRKCLFKIIAKLNSSANSVKPNKKLLTSVLI